MFRFFHSADWQLGARFRQFGAHAEALRQARLTTLRRSLELASSRKVDAYLVAGDLFEDNQVADTLVAEVIEIFSEHPTIPIYLLPGNHDPISGPESVWQRTRLLNLPQHIHILREAGTVDLGSAMLLASPLSQKVSTTDPSLVFTGMQVPTDRIRIGITHGALAIESRHQPNDFPVALNAASRAGLDYLALGHWHNWLADTDDGRIVMPGTPEPDRFSTGRSGHVAYVEIDAPGHLPRVEPVDVSTLTWRLLEINFNAEESSRVALNQELQTLRQQSARTLLRITLTGVSSPQTVAHTIAGLEDITADFFLGQIVDSTRIALDAAQMLDLQTRHPILCQVLADIDQLESFALGTRSTISPPGSADQRMTLEQAQTLLGAAKIELAGLPEEFFKGLRQLLFETLREVTE